MSETTVGSIVGFLRLDASQWNEELDKAEAKAAGLGAHDPKIKIELNATEIIAKLDAVSAAVSAMDKNQTRLTLNGNQSLKNLERAYASTGTTAKQGMDRAAESTRKVTTETEKLDKANKDTRQSGSALVTAIIALGPALVPIAAGAAGLAAGFGGMGAAGVLAIAGIKDQMKQGTAEGLTYKSTLDGAKASIMTLATTAAGNVLGPLQQAIGSLDSRLPSLNSEIGLLATATGKVGASVVNGLLSAFVQLEPVMSTVAVYAVNLAARFDAMMSGPGVKSFGDYALSVFPQVMSTLESLVEATVHLVAAFAPLGGSVLTEVKLLADVINMIDPSVLSVLATTVGSVAIGFKAWQGLSGLVSGLGGALEKVGFSADAAAVGVRGLEAAAGVVGVVLAGLSIIMASGAEANRQNQQAVDDLTQALIQSNGVLDEHVRKVQYDSLQSSGVVDTYKALGGSVRDLTDAALGNADAQGRVNAVLAAAKPAADDYGQAGVDVNGVTVSLTDATSKVATALGTSNDQLKAGQTAQKDYADAMAQNAGQTSAQATAAQTLADRYGVTTAALQAASDAQDKQATKAADATSKMILENDAAGLLKQSLDALNGKSLDLASAQTSSASATLSASKALKDSKRSLDETTDAGIRARQSIEGKVRADQALAEATGKATGSTQAEVQSLKDSKAQLENTLRSQGLLTKGVQDYIDRLYDVKNLKVPPTKLEADTKAAEAKVHTLDDDIRQTMRDRQANLFINVSSNVNAAVASVSSAISAIGASVATAKPPGRATGGPVPGFAGGTLIGPGTGTSDSILAMVAQTGNLLRVSAGEFISTDASRQRNLAALEAGNRGAVLQVAGQGSASGATVHQTFNVQPTDPYVIARETARYYDMLGA